jgi:hypothetical protein
MKKLLVLASLIGAAVGGCSKDDNPAAPANTGTMQVTMVDAPASVYDSLVVSIKSVEAHSATASESWITLNSETRSYNILSLVNGTEALIGQASLSAGHYTQIRIVLGDSCWAYLAGVKITLTVPSAEIKLNVDATIQADVTYKMVVDFDASRSIVSTGTGLIMKPVLKVLTTSQSGFISGSVNTKAAVFAYSGTDTISTVTGESNMFKLMYVKPGTYAVEVVPAATNSYYSTTINGVTVTAGETTNIGAISLQAK